MTIRVKIENCVATEIAPIARKFIGQPARQLLKWLEKQGEVRKEVIG